jgi:hypothetical protein
VEDDQRFGEGVLIGKAQWQQWIRDLGENVDVIVLSFCQAQSLLLGDDCVAASIKHVVACRHDSKLNDQAAIGFVSILWETLATGEKTVQFAFDMALQVTTDRYGPQEAGKFVLLPKGRNHNTKIHIPDSVDGLRISPRRDFAISNLPPRPRILIGRTSKVKDIITALTDEKIRFVRVYGPAKAGKAAVVNEACHYIQARRKSHSLKWNRICWFTYNRSTDRKHPCYESLKAMFEATNFSFTSEQQFSDRKEEICHQFLKALYSQHHHSDRTTVVVFKIQELKGCEEACKMSCFVEELLRQSNTIKILVIRDQTEDEAQKIRPGELSALGH